jgi:hypothetical protein
LPMMRLSAGLIVAAFALLAGVTGVSASAADRRTVPSGQSIASTRFPYFGSNRPESRYRQVLGVVAVPPAFMRQVVHTRQTPWPYWRKQGLVVRASGKAVTHHHRAEDLAQASRDHLGQTASARLARSGLKAATRLRASGTPTPGASSFVLRQHVSRSSSVSGAAPPRCDSA